MAVEVPLADLEARCPAQAALLLGFLAEEWK